MRISLIILLSSLALAILAGPALPSPRLGQDGKSLVLDSNDSRHAATSGDTLYHLLGQEVRVFIFNSKARFWPRMIVRSGPRPWQPMSHPQLEVLIHKYSSLYGVDPSLVRAVMRHESGFNPGAVSPKGAQGLMQLMPGTAALMGVSNPFDPEQNIAGGVGYLRLCLDRFQHNIPLAVAAYNAGPEAVAKYCNIPPYSETQLFVHNVMGSYTGQYRWSHLPAAPRPAAAAAKPGTPPAKPAKQTASQEQAPKEKPRPRPKVIEVRSFKPPPRVIRPK